MKKLLTTIPFNGFYESEHAAELDRAVEDFFDPEGNGTPDIPDNFYWSFNKWGEIRLEYVKVYLRNFEDAFNEATGLALKLPLESMTSPREYNFETDRLFAYISKAGARRLRKYVDNEKLAELIRDTFTSYDGFWSHYSNDLSDHAGSGSFKKGWPKDVTEWDHNQLGTLIQAALLTSGEVTERDDWRRFTFDFMEGSLCNGFPSDICYGHFQEWLDEHADEIADAKLVETCGLDADEWERLPECEKREKRLQFEASRPAPRCDKTPDMFNH